VSATFDAKAGKIPRVIRSIATIGVSVFALALVGCERAPAPRVTASQPTPPVVSPSVSQPAPPPEKPVEPASAPASAPADDVPAYVTVAVKRSPDRMARVKAETRGDNTLILTTENAAKIVLRNESLPTRAIGSVFLRIDGKVIEWTRRQASLELERTPNGDWIVPDPASKP
jgi:hypothetical protein